MTPNELVLQKDNYVKASTYVKAFDIQFLWRVIPDDPSGHVSKELYFLLNFLFFSSEKKLNNLTVAIWTLKITLT